MKLLKPIAQHRTIDFSKDIGADLDDSIGADAEDVRVVRRVVDLAQRGPVRDHRCAERMRIRKDVGRVEELSVTESADGAGRVVRRDDAIAERGLVQPETSESRRVRATEAQALGAGRQCSGEALL